MVSPPDSPAPKDDPRTVASKWGGRGVPMVIGVSFWNNRWKQPTVCVLECSARQCSGGGVRPWEKGVSPGGWCGASGGPGQQGMWHDSE